MSVDLEPTITHDLMVLQAHMQTQPSLVPRNLDVVMGWNVIGELVLVSQLR